MAIDARHIATGSEIPSEGYCDQPYVVVNADGSWTCVMTTGTGHEGAAGQHVVATISQDQGKTWSELYDVEPATGPEASWAVPLLAPETGRIYAFYTYNKDNQREVLTEDGYANGKFGRVDSLGVYAYRYSDDCGRTWSAERYEIPMRMFQCDRDNIYGGKVQFFWGVGKPFIHKKGAYVVASKCGGFGRGFFTRNEGVLFHSPNLLTETDPAKHEWETLPDGDKGLRTPRGGGPIAGELHATPLNDGSLFGTYRTIDGWSCHGYSRDDGHTWETGWMTYGPGKRRVKNPRSANFVWRCSNGNYLYWFCFHGGKALGRRAREAPELGYESRNPIWLCGGVEKDGVIHWSEPEVILYDDKIGNRMSYPDFVEANDRYYYTETQKEVARVHELDRSRLELMWASAAGEAALATHGLALDVMKEACEPGAQVDMPQLPELHNRERHTHVDAATGATLSGGPARQIEERGGFAIELWLRFDTLQAWQVVFDTRTPSGEGILVQLTDRRTLKFSMSGALTDTPGSIQGNGRVESSMECDLKLLKRNHLHQVLFIVDGGPKLISVMVDGVLCDGGDERQFGWGRFHPYLRHVNGAPKATLAPHMRGTLERVRIYDRYLLSNEGTQNYRAGI